MGESDPETSMCPYCSLDGREVPMRHEPGLLICDNCATSFPVPHDDEVELLVARTERDLQNSHPALFTPGMECLSGSLGELNQDAWWMVALGRHNAGIILMGALVEAVLQKVLYVHRYEHFFGSLGSLISYLRSQKTVDQRLLRFADEFREYIRNKWQHQKDHEIVQGASAPVAVLKYDRERGLASLKEQIERVKTGEIPMERRTVEDLPGLRYPLKKTIDEQIAVPLYNQTWLWVLFVASRYLRESHYAELRKRHGDGPPVTVKYRNGKRREVEIEADVGVARRFMSILNFDGLAWHPPTRRF